MHGSKLIKLIKTFTKNELKALGDFLQSPYFHTNKQLKEYYTLFSIILKHQYKSNPVQLNKDSVYSVLFPNETFVKGKLEKRMTALLHQIHRFIGLHFSDWYDDSTFELLNVAHFYRQRKQFGAYERLIKKGKIQLKSLHQSAPSELYKQFLLDKETYQNQALWHKSDNKFQLFDQLQALDAFYLLHKLEYACFYLSLQFRRPLETEEMVAFLETIRPLYQKKGLLEIPLINIYYCAFDLLKKSQPGLEAYYRFKALFVEYETVIPDDYLKSLANFLRGFIIMRCNAGEKQLWEELFDLYKKHLPKGYLSEETGILPSTFKNAVTIALRSKAYDWVWEFLHAYKNQIIGTSNPEQIFNFNLALYYFHQNAFDEALTLLDDQYEDLYYKMAAKRMELKIYFETDSELLDSKMDAFKIFIFRLPKNNIQSNKQESDNNFINFLRQLRNPKTKFDRQRIEKLKSSITSCLYLSEREWLLKKLKST